MFPESYDAFPLPPRSSLEQYKKLAKDLAKAFSSADSESLRMFASAWIAALSRRIGITVDVDTWMPQFQEFVLRQASEGQLRLSRAQFVLARVHGFASWPKFARHVEAIERAGSPESDFEEAAEAIVGGNIARLQSLLQKDPALVRARSPRQHRATLLHYIGANGVEGFRQKTPANARQMAELLLASGAEVDAKTDLYGGKATTLDLVVTSVHPEQAGLQEGLMGLLIERGASLHRGSDNLVSACLANGRYRAAQFLAAQGAELDCEAAAGLGRIDLLRTFLEAGQKQPTQQQMERGLGWACEYGRNDVVEYLLQRGVSPNSKAATGQTALHWAVIGAQTETIKILLSHGANLESRNSYGGTALGQAVWCSVHDGKKTDYRPVIDLLLKSGAVVHPDLQQWLDQQKAHPSS